MVRFLKVLTLALCALPFTSFAASPLLLRNPSISADKVAFLYAGDIWTAPREGGAARRLTSEGTIDSGPYFSPDGSRIAYSAKIAGADDVYLIDANGGIPKRLTWHPEGNFATGWTADGSSVLFATMRSSYSDFLRLYTVRADGAGIEQPLPLPTGVTGSYSSDGKSIAYVPVLQWEAAWKRYRGGQTTPIWLVDLKSLDLTKIPRENSNDNDPVWVGDTVYFLSDRNGPVSLFSYDTRTKAVTQVVENHTYDLKSVTGGPVRWSTNSSARCISTTWLRIRTRPSTSPSTAICPPYVRIWPPSLRRRSRTSLFLPPESVPSSRPMATSSQYQPRRAILAI